MTGKLAKQCSTSLAIGKCKPQSDNAISVKMMKIKQIDNVSGKEEEQLETFIVGRNTKWCRYFEKQFGSYL